MRSPGEIVSAIPHLLGFLPTESLVCISLRGKQVGMSARIDLTDADDRDCRKAVIDALRRDRATAAIVVGFGSDRAEVSPVVCDWVDMLREERFGVADEISVIGDRWFHERCQRPACCPPEGTPVADHASAPSTLAVRAATGGYLPDRAAIEAECHPDRPLLLAAIRSILTNQVPDTDEDEVWQRADVSPEGLQEAVASDICALLGWGEPRAESATRMARAAMFCSIGDVRDLWYCVVAPGMMTGTTPRWRSGHAVITAAGFAAGDLDEDGVLLDTDARDRVLTRLLGFVRNLPDDLPHTTMPALTVAAAAFFCAGDGVRALSLAERAHRLPVAPLGMLTTVTNCLAAGFRPEHLGALSQSSPGRGRVSRRSA
ncbi:MAG: DUF4192 family protein [Actinomycetia bacterium]|nr:DUF4192 family protein [Actinomycetes bacterium]